MPFTHVGSTSLADGAYLPAHPGYHLQFPPCQAGDIIAVNQKTTWNNQAPPYVIPTGFTSVYAKTYSGGKTGWAALDYKIADGGEVGDVPGLMVPNHGARRVCSVWRHTSGPIVSMATVGKMGFSAFGGPFPVKPGTGGTVRLPRTVTATGVGNDVLSIVGWVMQGGGQVPPRVINPNLPALMPDNVSGSPNNQSSILQAFAQTNPANFTVFADWNPDAWGCLGAITFGNFVFA